MKSLIYVTAVILMTLLILQPLTAEEKMVIRFESPDEHIVREFTQDKYDIASYRPGDYLDIVVTARELADIIAQGYNPSITQTEERLKSNLERGATRIEGYRNYQEILTELEELRDNFPELTRLYDIGDSWGKIYTDEGNDYYQNYTHDIWALKLTANPDSLADKPAVFYFGAHHAREPISAEVPMDFLQLLLEGYGEDQEITFLIDNTEVWFVPLVNPDGHKIVLDRHDVWWRKNIRDNNNNGRFDTQRYFGAGADGVDLNRNYGFEWRHDARNNRATYPGPEAGSEPEVAAIKQLFAENHFVAGITYHTYGEMVLFPYGYAVGCRAPDHLALQGLSDKMARATPKFGSQGHYLSQQSLELYPARGVTDDYAYGKYGIFCYTFEMATEFIPPAEAIRQISEDNMEAAMILLSRIQYATLTGIITDALTGEPITAGIYIPEIDDTGSFRHPYTSREPFGRYYRILEPGEYEVIFKGERYSDTEIYNIVISEDEQTVLNVELYPLMEGSLTGTVVNYRTQEPVSGATIEIVGSVIEPVQTDEEGFFEIEHIYYRPYTLKISADDFGTLYKELIIQEPETAIAVKLFPPHSVETFETADNWETNGAWGLSTIISYIGDYSLADSPNGDYQDNIESFARYNGRIDLTEAYNASVTFMAIYGIEEGYDYCYVQVMPDDAEAWETVAAITGSSEWTRKDIPLAEYCGLALAFRFLFVSDGSIIGTGIYIDDFRIYISTEDTSAVDEQTLPAVTTLDQNYPNPFNPETTISFALPASLQISLEVFDIKGRKVAALIDEHLPEGKHTIIWDGTNRQQTQVSSGIYFYRLTSAEGSLTRRMVLLK